MLSRTRWLTVALVACLAAPPARAADLSKYLPDDTEMVLGVNVAQIMGSPLVQKHVPTLVAKYALPLIKFGAEASGQKLDDDQLKLLQKNLGDADTVRKWLAGAKSPIQRMLIAGNLNEADERVLLVLEGSFDKEELKKILDAAADLGALGIKVKKEKVGKNEVYAFKFPGEDEEHFAGVADGKTVLIATTKDDLVKALSRADKTGPSVRKELVEVAKKVAGTESVWVVAAPKDTDDFTAAHGTVAVTDGIKVEIEVTTKDADKAKELQGQIKDGIKDLADSVEGFAKDFKPLGDILSAFKDTQVTVAKNVVTIKGGLSAEAIDKVMKNLP